MADVDPPTLIVGDWQSWCGVCSVGADPAERTHATVLAGLSGRDGAACGVEWTHVQADVTSRISAGERIREMRPDLAFRDGR